MSNFCILLTNFDNFRDNGVEEATEAETHYIVKYFDSNADEMIEYEDLM